MALNFMDDVLKRLKSATGQSEPEAPKAIASDAPKGKKLSEPTVTRESMKPDSSVLGTAKRVASEFGEFIGDTLTGNKAPDTKTIS